MEPLPLPPEPFAPPSQPAWREPRRRGEVTSGWGTALWVAWIGVAAGFVAVWVSSRNTGLSTWWTGPEADPRPLLLPVLVVFVPIMVAAAAFRSMPWVSFFGIAAAAFLSMVGLADLHRVSGYAAVELCIVAGGALVSVASLAGLYRR